jgi:hypothetical protein
MRRGTARLGTVASARASSDSAAANSRVAIAARAASNADNPDDCGIASASSANWRARPKRPSRSATMAASCFARARSWCCRCRYRRTSSGRRIARRTIRSDA